MRTKASSTASFSGCGSRGSSNSWSSMVAGEGDFSSAKIRDASFKISIKENVAARYVSMNNGRRAIMVHVRQALSDTSNDIHPCHPVQLLSVLFSAQHLRQRTPFKSCYFVEEALPISDLS
nr:hypothetical protein Iba_chr14fCG13350 [Ipomoea batatas]